MVIENRDLAAGTKLIAKYKGEQWRLEVLPGEPRTYGFVGKRPTDSAQVYKSPSSAGSAVMGGTACNGWRFWSVEGEANARATVKATGKAKATAKTTKPASRKPRAQAKPAVLQRHKNQKDLGEGQVRWLCNACLKHFIVDGDATPEACPEGHRNDDPELTTPASTDEAE
jgi:hypothetical protein